ncbi:MAG: hypothetical protein A3E01_10715 [Gammaproteobacteria bacterium RIFCSPHIGHO2_12_FULL_63_22]|nr:MAG: hypothetical protein A3E01_10715 [Gammaproteobacteria bacterium RIFCSPHIGHO2_12_FULL_63_22]
MRREISQPESISGPLTHALFRLSPPPDPNNPGEFLDYPADDGTTTVYWGVRLLSPTFPLAVGAQVMTFDESEIGNFLWADAAVFYADDSLVLADQQNGRWFIRGLIRAPEDE